jgi:cell wall-associated NlpC family hydrolase
MSDDTQDQQGQQQADPLAADKAALATAQAALAAAQAEHDTKAAALAAAEEAHAAAHEALGREQQLLKEAQDKLTTDTAALQSAVEAHAATVASTVTGVAADVKAEAESHLAEAEQIAQKWGGDVGTDLRNLVGKIRALFGLSTTAS